METLAIQTFNQAGVNTPSKKNFSSNGLSSNEYTAKLADQYFIKTNDFPWSPGMASGLLEMLGAGALLKCFPGPATLVNLLTTIAETSQLLVSKSTSLSKQVKDGLLAWFQVVSGTFGLLGVAKETIFNNEEQNFKEVPFIEKLALSGASLANIFSMGSCAVERSLLSMVCWNREDKTKGEYRSSLTTALGDRRSFGEWFVMAAIPWISNIEFVKKFVDVGISYMAIREGLDTFAEEGNVTFLSKNIQGPKLQKTIKAIINPFSLLAGDKKEENNKTENPKYKLFWPFDKMLGFFIGRQNDEAGKGQSGFRNYFIKPLFMLLGCNPPLYYLDGENNIVVEFEGKIEKETIETEEEQVKRDEPARTIPFASALSSPKPKVARTAT